MLNRLPAASAIKPACGYAPPLVLLKLTRVMRVGLAARDGSGAVAKAAIAINPEMRSFMASSPQGFGDAAAARRDEGEELQ